ncbi:Melatonin receptor type 1A [Willisornis vidua]|uniref:Melatonin receptor type 1A n=1 Tax=Willisornis vidua TaxID=1566151 RepID=A0ABQ9CSL8_9PASS|nr:Melatonin receptor type 1A [Willisornis vidua]
MLEIKQARQKADLAEQGSCLGYRAKKLNLFKSMRPDGIHLRILKEIADVIAKPLSMIFEQSWESREVPANWKLVNIVPNFRKGKKEDRRNYRPASLTSVTGKVMKNIILESIEKHLKDNTVTGYSQQDFMRGKSCLSSLISFYDKATYLADQGNPVDVIFWGFSKAFDTVCYRVLVDKMSSRQLDKHIVQWMSNWLMGNVFVVSLAIADLIVAIYPYPLVLTSVFHNGWKLGYLHCQISGFLMGLSVIGSIFNITGIAINRYCYICHSLKYDKLYSDKNSLCYVVLIWVLTVVAIVPNLFVGSLQYDPRIYSCTFAQSVSSAYTIAVVFFHFLLPIAVVTFCYLRIWILVIQVRRRVKPDNNPRLKPHDFRNFVTMFVVFVLFAVCWAPLNFIGLAVAVNPKTVIPRIPEWLFVSSYYMAYFNSCLNAIVYGLLNQNFRREYKRIIVTFCTANVFFQDSSNDAGDRMRSKPSPLITNNNQVKVDSV